MVVIFEKWIVWTLVAADYMISAHAGVTTSSVHIAYEPVSRAELSHLVYHALLCLSLLLTLSGRVPAMIVVVLSFISDESEV